MLYSRQHNLCVYDIPDPARVLACVSTARKFNGSGVAVPAQLHEMQLMRFLGYEAMSPMTLEYDWPIRPPLKPFAHQKQMAAFLTLHPRCFNLSDLGTAKTLASLWAWDYLMTKGFIKKVLILAPLSTIYRVWEDEIFQNFLSRRRCAVVYGDREKRSRILQSNADFYIINHDGLGVGSEKSARGVELGEIAQTIRDNPDISAFGVDEGSVYKDSGTVRYKVLRQVLADKPYVWWLTATPTPNEPVDAWAQARIVRKDYQESQRNFRDRTMYKISTFKWLPRPGAAQTTAEVLQPAIRFNRDECLDLPECMYETRDVELTKEQKKAIDEMKRTLQLLVKEKQITAVNEAALRLKLIQIACGAVYDEQHKVHYLDASPRLKILHEVIESTKEKIIVFAPLTSVVTMVTSELSKSYPVEMVNGSTSAAKRNQVFRDFQQCQTPRIIVADPGCMAHGLTLTAAATIVWYGPTDKPETYTQANGRINRPGQRNNMLVVRLASTSTEREIFRRLDNKEDMQGVVLKIVEGE